MLTVGGAGAWLFFSIVRGISAWLLTFGNLPALVFWALCAAFALYVISQWLKPEGTSHR
jgi:hypothetical protein